MTKPFGALFKKTSPEADSPTAPTTNVGLQNSPSASQPSSQTRAAEHLAFLNFVYQLLFGRDAEPIAVEHWTKYLAQGLPYKELFEALWKSEEFAEKVEQNRFVKRYSEPHPESVSDRRADQLIDDRALQRLVEELSTNRTQLFEIPTVRSLVSQWRYRDLNAAESIKFYDGEVPDVLPNTAAYNELSLRSSVGLDRGTAVIYPLRAISWIQKDIDKLKVLVVGARSEVELFALLAAGFQIQNITMVDLISYSPFVEIGDMHNLRFADDSFDLVLLAHVLSYSATRKKAAHELCRVTKPGGIVSFCEASAQLKVECTAPDEMHISAIKYSNCAEVIETFAPYVGDVIFKLEPREPYDVMSARVALTFVVQKN